MLVWLLQKMPSVGQATHSACRDRQLSSPALQGSHSAGHSGGMCAGLGPYVPGGHAVQPDAEVIMPFAA